MRRVVTSVTPREGETFLAALCRAACTRITADVGWDVAPSLAIVTADEYGHLALITIPLPETVWSMARPANVIAWLAQGRMQGITMPAKLAEAWRGYALIHEAWGFAADRAGHTHDGQPCPNPDNEGCTYYEWTRSGRSIADHPDGREQRWVWGFLADGSWASACYTRGEKQPKVATGTRGQQPEPGGNIPDAMWALVDSTKTSNTAARN